MITMDKFRLHSELRHLRQFANDRAFALLSAYDRNAGTEVSPLALGAYERLLDATATLIELPAVDEDPDLSEHTINKLARLVAVAIHGHISTRYQAGRLAPISEDPALIVRAIGQAEKRYIELLLSTRSAAKNGRIERLADVLAACLESATGNIAYAAFTLAGQDNTAKSAHLAAVRIAHIARRTTMLSAATLILMFRLTNSNKATGLRKVAENRVQLARSEAEMLAAVQQINGASAGERVRLQAQCSDIAWVDDGDGYTKITVDAGQISELRLSRRNAQRAGLAKGSWLYLAGILAEDAGTKFLQVGLRAVSSNAADVWEDYLISETRSIFDLVPGSIDMLWELPDLREIGGRNELHGRL